MSFFESDEELEEEFKKMPREGKEIVSDIFRKGTTISKKKKHGKGYGKIGREFKSNIFKGGW